MRLPASAPARGPRLLAPALAMLCILAAAPPAGARVGQASETALTVERTLVVPAAPARAYALFTALPRWWDPAHSYGGTLRFDARPGGCWCETLPAGGVEHGRVRLARPGVQLVIEAMLGPVMTDATAGRMTVDFAADAKGTLVTMRYRATGFAPGQAAPLLAPIEGVLGAQLARYAAFVRDPRSSVTKR